MYFLWLSSVSVFKRVPYKWICGMLASLNLHLFSVVHILEFVQTNEAVVELLIVYRKR